VCAIPVAPILVVKLMGQAWLVSIISSTTFLLSAFWVVSSDPEQKGLQHQVKGHGNRWSDASSRLPGDSLTDDGLFAQAATGYQPKEEVYLADPSNYGERFDTDPSGQVLDNDYIVVLHETVGSASSAINLFQTYHPNDNDQVSYHTLITLDGTIVYVVSPEQRAFGAGNSTFQRADGQEETVFTNLDFPSSVNNFAYHISLETPSDGQNSNATTHSGYTEAQYQSLAWLLARTTVPNERITTHQKVDRSGSRIDPRSFETERLLRLLDQYPARSR